MEQHIFRGSAEVGSDAGAPLALSAALPAHYTIAQAAAYLQTSEKTLRRMIAAGDLAEVRIGRQIRIAEPDLVALLHKGRSR
ncbi:MAG TPA: helix-turn-helix domain-containing protein [Candidatus Acidoferrum sp.]|nr:helix-turn-helix domain-containing protein [Candidatus Acidoferrum sp.]